MFSLRKIYNYEDDDEEKDNYEDDNPLTCPFSKYLTCLSLLNYIWNCFLLIIFQNEAWNRFIFVVVEIISAQVKSCQNRHSLLFSWSKKTLKQEIYDLVRYLYLYCSGIWGFYQFVFFYPPGICIFHLCGLTSCSVNKGMTLGHARGEVKAGGRQRGQGGTSQRKNFWGKYASRWFDMTYRKLV